KQEFERQIKLARKESEYAYEEAHQLEATKQSLEVLNQTLNAKLESEIHKNMCLRFAVESSQQQNDSFEQDEEIIINNNVSIPTSRLTNISSRKAIKSLQRLGFQKDRQTGDHVILQKKQTITISIPHSRQESNPLTLKSILRQAQVSLDDFLNNL
ncbi:MAG: type II toxin-antitoxin system HicA family toxin, partial [Cyanobacteria bacterium P01_G01_bin.49]